MSGEVVSYNWDQAIEECLKQYSDILRQYPAAEYLDEGFLDIGELLRVETRADAMKLNAEEIMEICGNLQSKIKRLESDLKSTAAGSAKYSPTKRREYIKFLSRLRNKVMKSSTVQLGELNGDEDD
jgi:hypothetical protein